MIAQVVQIITERGVQTSTSGTQWWEYVVGVVFMIGYLAFVISYIYWQPRNLK